MFFSDSFLIKFGVRQGSVLSPLLFAIYLDDLPDINSIVHRSFVVLYADDVLLIAPSVTELQRLLHLCEKELMWLDMHINEKKSCCLRIGPRFDLACTCVVTSDGHKIPWVNEIRYLGTYIVAGRQLRCSITHSKRSFHRSLNAIFGKIGRIASEEVTLELVKCKCFPILLYGLDCFCLPKADLKSLDFVVTRFLMKLFKSSNNDIISDCRQFFQFSIPSELLAVRKTTLEAKFLSCYNLLNYFGIKTLV